VVVGTWRAVFDGADGEGAAAVTGSLASRAGRTGWSRAVAAAAAAIVVAGLLTAAAAAEDSDVAGSLKVLAHLRWAWLAAGIALEVISIAAFAA
jgi:3-oxoacyl-ACP reductase-like protein